MDKETTHTAAYLWAFGIAGFAGLVSYLQRFAGDNPQPWRWMVVFTKVLTAGFVVGSDPTTNKALGLLRQALDKSQSSVDATGGPFAPAVKLAAARFKQLEQVPAIAVNAVAQPTSITPT